MVNPLKYSCLFGGGAIRGLAYVGTIRALEELGIEYDIIAGSSVGAIIASLVACGYKSYEIENFFMKVKFDLFKDIHLGFGDGFALSKGGIFQNWLNELLSSKFDKITDRVVNFGDIEKKLIIITTDIKNFKPVEFSTYKTPEFSVAQAIKISSSMPGLMAPYEYNNSYLVDGDLQKASPMWKLSPYFDNSEGRILEFRLEGDYSKDEKNPISFINTIYSCVTEFASDFVSEIYGKNDKYDCISINTGSVFFADFNLSKDERRKLIELGYEQTMNYFKKVLPAKKEALTSVYLQILTSCKKLLKGLKSKNVEEVEWWFGKIFTVLCENKEIIDPKIYAKIIETRDLITNNTATLLFFYQSFKNLKELIKAVEEAILILDERVTDLKLYLQIVDEN